MILTAHNDQPLRGLPVAILDFETTGRDPEECWPVSVAIAQAELGRPAELVLNTLVRCGHPIDEGATAVHGITEDQLVAAPPLADVAQSIAHALEGRVLLVYNLPFDWQILERVLRWTGECEDLPFVGICGYVLARAVDKYERGKKLGQVCARRGISLEAAHDAGADVLATAQVVPLLLRDLYQGGHCGREVLNSYASYLDWQSTAAMEQEADFTAYCQRQGRPLPTSPWTRLLEGTDANN